MRAWQVVRAGEPSDVLTLVELPSPDPPPGRVRIRVTAAAVALPDVFMCRGIYPLTPPLPFTPGQEAVGTVLAAGEGVDIPVGTRVMGVTDFIAGSGGFAEEALLLEGSSFPAPETMDAAHAAAFFISYHTAWIGLVTRAELQPGERLLVLGAAGGTGAAAIQLGKALGAHVVAVAGGREKVDYCRRLGADEVIDHHTESIEDGVARLVGARGIDAVYDPVGGAPAMAALDCLANAGRLLAVGFASGTWPTPSVHEMVIHNYSVVGVFAGAYDRAFREEAHAALLALVDDGRLRPGDLVTSTARFEEVPAALTALAQRDVCGRTVITNDR
jgi:NADPH:quinone reductase